MAEHDEYMTFFYKVFEGMARQGPGDEDTALRLLGKIPQKEKLARIVDMGCGTGAGSLLLAEQTCATITAVDNYRPFLDRLHTEAVQRGYGERIVVCEASMFEPPCEPGSLDLIWSEGSAYLMGFENALTTWRSLLRQEGFLVVSDLCWFTAERSAEAARYWAEHYPDIHASDERIAQAKALGFAVLDALPLPRAAWDRFFANMKTQLVALRARHGENRAFLDCEKEMALFARFGDEFGYYYLLLRKM